MVFGECGLNYYSKFLLNFMRWPVLCFFLTIFLRMDDANFGLIPMDLAVYTNAMLLLTFVAADQKLALKLGLGNTPL